ncbi:TetR/AcrR family transcriptional regulator [Arenivirga flava]|uniref:TetR family transcriptional regulator n=1 Tax=Arenivirga flava TaxID=1930060 RepID=A0AA37UCS8_9MICO|nr:TetR/AcrR family transcriptional regulator [Arenivirga flava]GMA26948.1 TetR family transcriptional regulator [Arenivirga flava]
MDPSAADHDAERPLRADAARNRTLILDTARRVFADRGIGATLNDVAREAGVGVGTVYRRFADKEALLAALRADKFTALRALAAAALRVDDPREALRGYLHEVIALRVRDRLINEVVAASPHDHEALRAERERLSEDVERVIARARDVGAVREGFAARDVPVLTLMVGALADRSASVDPEAWRRYASLLVDAVCPTEEPMPMPGGPFGEHQLPLVMHPRP